MRGFALCILLIAGSYGLPQYNRPNHGGGGGGCGAGSSNCGGAGGQIGGGGGCNAGNGNCGNGNGNGNGRRPNHGGGNGGAGNAGNGGRRPNHGGNNQGNGGANSGFGNLPDGCRIEFQTVHSIEEIEKEENVCTPYTDNECRTVNRRVCNDYQDRECKRVPKQKCETKFEEVCQNLWRDVPETYTEDVCTTNNVRTCQQHWKTYPNGDKKWEDNPDTCQDLPQTKCEPVQKSRNKPEQYRDCKQVPKQNCYVEQVEECYDVTKQKCRNVPQQVCKQVTKERCEVVHTKTPQGKATQKAVRVCDNEIGSGHQQAGEDFEIIQIRQNAEPAKDDGSKIGFTFSQ